MAYVRYTNLRTANEVLEAMVTYITSLNYTIVQPLVDDLNIYERASTDGKKFCFQNKDGEFFILLRSANGEQVFGTTNDAAMDIATPDMNPNYTGIAMTVSEGYSRTARWYNQFRVPHAKSAVQVYGVFMPVDEGHNYTYTLYCNNISQPTDTIIFTLVKDNDTYMQHSHLIYGDVNKYDSWEGGAFFSGSSPISMMDNAIRCYEHTQQADQYIMPVCCSSTVSNSFLRINIDEAPLVARGEIYWASSGTNNETGKKLSLPVRTGDNMNGKIPHYYYMQSSGRLDWGRNINTLNAITINMPLYLAVLVDPDVLDNYAAVGHLTGLYFVSNLNMQVGCVYEISYPESNKLCQVFSIRGKRRGVNGFDGLSIQQFIGDS